MSPRLLALATLLLTLPGTDAIGALSFAETSAAIKATPQDKELQARYTFTNTGTEPIWIVQVTTSCGCTKAAADKTEYQPGETGVITATYTIGLSQGRHAYTIDVKTSEPGSQPYVLQLAADLPAATSPIPGNAPAISPSPRELVWARAPYTTKTIAITTNDVPGAKLTATCDSNLFKLKLDDSVRPALLQVTPSPEAGAIHAEITLQTTSDGLTLATQKIPLTLISLKKSSAP